MRSHLGKLVQSGAEVLFHFASHCLIQINSCSNVGAPGKQCRSNRQEKCRSGENISEQEIFTISRCQTFLLMFISVCGLSRSGLPLSLSCCQSGA